MVEGKHLVEGVAQVSASTSKPSKGKSSRDAVVSALLDSPDVQSVLRLTMVKNPADKTLVVAASVAMVDTIPVYAISSALDDARRRVREVIGEDSEIFVEPDLVKDPEREEPATDVIVIRASD
jgi:divalent metal cation (Fe/Co/Zn/Cd) transporter